MNQITYKLNTSIQPSELSHVFTESGIRRPADDLPRLKRMIENSDILISAWIETELVGIARAITDYSYCCYLSDLAVIKKYQSFGIGKELVRLLQEQLSEEVALILLSAPNAMEYYPHIGFEKIDNGFKVARKR
ncbi:GNAT family N-acetyltransferase [Halalkalibacter okhensis]|uniref:GCN5 family acetyltransferase n=1 Tax=Halalkalibacter okhensis TaxID=333138 RepID=A0A0B0IF96_9BACI|nr:GNAT family N-acetyltransferase [Halalkalibacter okhensis]KHF39965.1 GCN5 family acetyltransferase [Halalkalibacter okhensis]